MKHQFTRTTLTSLLIALTTLLSFPSAATSSVGTVKIDGTTIPEIHFEAFRQHYLPDQYKCSYEAARNGTIDYHVLHLIAQQINFHFKGYERNLEVLKKQIAKVKEGNDLELAKLELKKLTFPSRLSLIRHLGYEVTEAEKEKEYKNRVEQRDPNLVDVQVYKTLKIGPFRDKTKLVEAAKLIESGMSFEAVAEKIPSEKRKPTGFFKEMEEVKEKAWYTFDAIDGYDGDGSDLIPGYIVGLEELLEDNKAWVYSLTKIIDTKVIAQVKASDYVTSSISHRNPFHYDTYLDNRTEDWKYAQFMNSLWSQFEITENGLPIKRFHSYANCKSLF